MEPVDVMALITACSIVDAPSDLGLRGAGVNRLPGALRRAGLLHGIPDVRYAGRLQVPPRAPSRDEVTGVLNPGEIQEFGLRLAERVGSILDQGRFPLVLGGDCSILLGPALALRRRGRFGLFFMDGHSDFYSPETEPNGEVASMDLALVTGRGIDSLADIGGKAPLVRDEDVVVFGFRDAEQAAEFGSPDVRNSRTHVFDLKEIRRLGAAAAAAVGLSEIEGNGVEGFWVHLDADVLDDEVMPAVDHRLPGGLRVEELGDALATVLASPLAVGMDITIYNPGLDDADRSAGRALARVVTAAFERA